ncbi:CHASE2 domain-containing protein, partial [candidate division KSB1 bacterium]|nr:CHASE2 domain-containing protein [candidate division KSB1 bacterium]
MTYLGIILLLILLAATFDTTTIGSEFEWKSIDYRFHMRDELTPNQSISLVLLDEASRDKFGDAPYQRRIFATVIKGLMKLKAAVIGIDFRFEEASDKLNDSLLVDAIRKSENVVIGCYFRNIDPAPGSAVCYETEEMPPVWSPLMAAGASVGHLGVFLNQYNRQISFMPGFISVKDSLIPCFPLQIVKTFRNIEDTNVEIREDEIKLLIADNRSLEIPTNFSSEILINFLGDEEVFTNCYSFIDVHAYCKTILAGTGHQELSKEFENKIVLIGSLIDEDIFVTPYSYDFPGVLIHATVIDNILSQRFLEHLPYSEFFILPLLAFILYLIFLQTAYFRKIAGAAIVLVL